RRGAGRGGGSPGRAVRRPGRPAAERDAEVDRLSEGAGLYREHSEMPPAGEPRSAARRGRCVRGFPESPDRADPAEGDARRRAYLGAAAARYGPAGRPAARRRAPLRGLGDSARRDVSSGLSAADSDREGEELAGPLHALTVTSVVGAGQKRGDERSRLTPRGPDAHDAAGRPEGDRRGRAGGLRLSLEPRHLSRLSPRRLLLDRARAR